VTAPRAGYLAVLDAGRVGRAAAMLGAGRSRVGEPIDHGVGITVLAKPGAALRAGEAVLELHYRTSETLQPAMTLATEAVEISDGPVAPGVLVLEEVR
jgi:pyrimidine-nucleoside phosphorylase/thymidine phosphorylase